jgi:DsbC/DsbD-like thiol-disulfide interchange protein
MTSPAILFLFAMAAAEGGWGPPAVVNHDDQPVVTYRAQVAGGYLAVQVQLAAGWHTFTLDNDKRASAKLAGKKALSSDKPTQILPEGVEVTGAWLQPQPKDFSQPDLRIFSWGYEGEALFMAPAKAAADTAKVRIKGQACTQTVCKNVDITAEAPVRKSGAAPPAAGLIPVTQ